ncbi:endonuclease NucS domain-containing protein [Sphingomonas pseudosanguinis]|uniref:endonuclease NucS domain-containing protein n=1 Tax=Sphingomonas pseudosanguinis TaxID=413712 RepID=UPI003F849C8E
MTRLFRITEQGLVESRRKPLDLESRIEDWVARDLSLVGVDGFVIGRQVATDHGTRIDLLAMDEDGNLIIIELKRDRSPRDIVGQVLDYASWVRHLTTKDVHDLVRAAMGRSLPDLYRDRYGKAVPETLNASHQMIVVASEVDEATKRIIEYLSEEHDVGINASFFNIFGDQGHEWLTTDSLLDQEEVKDRAVKKARAPWSGLYYVTGGAEEDRPWEELRRYGFFTACGGRRYSNALDRLEIGAPIFYYQKNKGYLGYGLVTTAKMPATEFRLASGDLLPDVLPSGYVTDYADDPDMASYVVGVDWKRTFDRDEARWFSGIFANQNVVCKIYDQQTADFLREQFGVTHEESE